MLTLEQARALRDGITPGPWDMEIKTHAKSGSRSARISGGAWFDFARVWCSTEGIYQGQVDSAEGQANARLIAAAPDLLDLVDAQAAEVAALKEELVGPLALLAARYGESVYGSATSLHPKHYDRLAELGARMADFTRMTEPRNG